MQKHKKLPNENEEAKRKYQPSVFNALSKKRIFKSLLRGLVPHDLRSIYAAIVVGAGGVPLCCFPPLVFPLAAVWGLGPSLVLCRA